MQASLMCCGVSKSGSPTSKLSTSSPAARMALARAETARVGDGAIRLIRSDNMVWTFVFELGSETFVLTFRALRLVLVALSNRRKSYPCSKRPANTFCLPMTPETTPAETATSAPKAEAEAETVTPFEIPTWEDDETLATAIYRALFVICTAGFLAYAQWHAPDNWSGTIGQNWGRWVSTSVLCNFVLPLGIVWMFFGQGLVYQDWLKHQKHNAWNYGWNFSKIKRHALIALGCWAVSIPVIFIITRNSAVRDFYLHDYFPPTGNIQQWAFLLGTLTLYMFCWEWFFRGFMLFGTAQGLGAVLSIAVQAGLFGLTHYGKPPFEMWSAFAGGLVLGTLAWREKSFAPAFFIHALIHLTLAVFIHI
ncbi:CPBP family intramembrane metalloprotease [bacterium]|nr:MAG: CPBP family intramembrane metalloprotease [bacterium]